MVLLMSISAVALLSLAAANARLMVAALVELKAAPATRR